MKFYLPYLSCACALGRTNEEVASQFQKQTPLGACRLTSVVPNRSVVFGRTPEPLSPPDETTGYQMRANQFLHHAVEHFPDSFRATLEAIAPTRRALVLGSSSTGIHEAQAQFSHAVQTHASLKAPYFEQINLATPAKYLHALLDVQGPAYTISTACSSSAKAFASARNLLAHGVADAVVVGGVDAECCFALNGFQALGALAEDVCRPLAPDRDGINLGEGVALFLMTTQPCAGAAIELAGVGESSDAYHLTAPDPSGDGAAQAMRAALAQAHLAPEAIDYVNLHGTGTWANDEMEMKAIEQIWPTQRRPLIESTKNLTGHCLGAAGAIEVALCWLGLQAGQFAHTTMSNSFAFGGSNASVILQRSEMNG